MNTCLKEVIFSDKISEGIKLELMQRVLDRVPGEAVIDNLFFNACETEDYLYVLENIPRTGIFRDIKKGFWDRLNTMDEELICEVSSEYLRRASLKVLYDKGLVDENWLASDKDAAIVLTGLYKEWDKSDKKDKTGTVNKPEIKKKDTPDYSGIFKKGLVKDEPEKIEKKVENNEPNKKQQKNNTENIINKIGDVMQQGRELNNAVKQGRRYERRYRIKGKLLGQRRILGKRN